MKLPIAETKNDKAAAMGEIMDRIYPTVAVMLPGDPTGTDDVRTPAAEKPEETKIRKQFNACDIEGRKKVFGVDELSDDRTKLPYKRLPESDREIIRKYYATALPF